MVARARDTARMRRGCTLQLFAARVPPPARAGLRRVLRNSRHFGLLRRVSSHSTWTGTASGGGEDPEAFGEPTGGHAGSDCVCAVPTAHHGLERVGVRVLAGMGMQRGHLALPHVGDVDVAVEPLHPADPGLRYRPLLEIR